MARFDKKGPFAVEIKAGESVWICTCGQTKKPPFCDGSHKNINGTAGPEELKSETDTTTYVCACGKTSNGILCDGSHLK